MNSTMPITLHRWWTLAAALVLPTMPLACVAADNVATNRPNVLFIAIDDLKPLLGSYGVSWIKSPAMDRLAARGTVFTATYCQVPLCAPTRASLLSGLRPDSTRVYFNPFKIQNVLRVRLPDVVTLPQHFRANGYTTVAMGKVFDGRTVDQEHDSRSWSQPFVRRHEFAAGGPGVRGYQNPATREGLSAAAKSNPNERIPGPPTEGEDLADEAYLDGAIARSAVAKIRELVPQGRPFFLAVGFHKPHLPFIAPKKYWDLYNRETLPLASFQAFPLGSSVQSQVVPNSGEARDYARVPKTGDFPEALQRELIHGYAACISYIDAQVDLLMRTLEQVGVADNTIICLWGDHGWHLGEHGHWGKSTTYEDATRVPLIIAAPGVGRGVRTSSLTELLDVYPTLCELAGLPLPGHLQGKSLVPLMRDPSRTLHEAVFSQSSTVDSQMSPQLVGGKLDEQGSIASSMGWAVRTSRYRYVEWRHAELIGSRREFGAKALAVELYDYEVDPLERENLAGKREYRQVLQEHQQLFDRLRPDLPRREN
ncbi:MAG: sulfatase [Verrucomicrobia bacterium]|nr:sulfatase [Verrucomicrobiota bacterium]